MEEQLYPGDDYKMKSDHNIFSRKHILTAAHCFLFPNNVKDFPQHIFVVLRINAAEDANNTNLEDLTVQAVEKVQLYDNLTQETLLETNDNDIAILTLKNKLNFSSEV